MAQTSGYATGCGGAALSLPHVGSLSVSARFCTAKNKIYWLYVLLQTSGDRVWTYEKKRFF